MIKFMSEKLKKKCFFFFFFFFFPKMYHIGIHPSINICDHPSVDPSVRVCLGPSAEFLFKNGGKIWQLPIHIECQKIADDKIYV